VEHIYDMSNAPVFNGSQTKNKKNRRVIRGAADGELGESDIRYTEFRACTANRANWQNY
jgi:hypothetical protein